MAFAKKNKLKVVEDCAHATETEYRGKKAGTMGDIGCFSFYVTKNLVTGEGGMAITDNKGYADKIKVLALHGMSADAWHRFGDKGYKHYQVTYPGYKYNMMDIQAALGIHQLARLERNWKRRERIWKKYNAAFKDLPVFLPEPVAPGDRHAYHLYTLLLDIDTLGISRDDFLEEMTKRKIGVGVHFTALHLHPYHRKTYGYKRGDFPNAEWISDRTVSLPLSAKLSDADVQDVIEAVSEILSQHAR
jgi:dTDP-4-amino-4,6-dideoxygalactose transaminase